VKSNDLYKATIRIQNYVETWKNQKQPEQQNFVQQEVVIKIYDRSILFFNGEECLNISPPCYIYKSVTTFDDRL
jgi:hypothetical protein